jgi:glycine/D-amino acid oxidase-like deaminating enzyme
MDLRSGEPYWGSRDHQGSMRCAALDQPAKCDVLIVGAGVTGAIAADMLSAEGVDVIVTDKRDIGQGSTAASTALLMYEIDTPLIDLARRYGPERAARYYQISLRCLRGTADLTHGLQEACDFSWRKSLYLASRRSHARTLAAECEARRNAGIEVDLLGEADITRLFPFSAPAALLSHHAAQVDPLKLTRGLLKRAMSRGTRVFGRTCIDRIEQSQREMVVATAAGPAIHARTVVIAAGYESGWFLDNAPGTLRSTYVACSRPVPVQPAWHDGWLIWETSRPYAYLRTTSDGRAIIGGADVPFKNPTARDALLPRRTRMLARRFAKMFPDLPFDIEFAWTGTFGESEDGLPYIGATPSRPGCLLAMGYGGNGLTWGVLAAEIIRDACLGRANREAELFAMDRPA